MLSKNTNGPSVRRCGAGSARCTTKPAPRSRGGGVMTSSTASFIGARAVHHHAADRLAALHELEAFIDALERQAVRDQRVDVDAALHVPVDDARHIGAAAGAAECRAAPHATGHELEGAGRDLLAGTGYTDDDALPPAAVAALQRLAH